MKPFRLTNNIRDAIIKDMIRHRFLKECTEHVTRRAQFAVKVYEDLYSTETRKQFDAIAKGWLPEKSSFIVVFAGNYTELNFNGSFDAHYNHKEYIFPDNMPVICKPFMAKDTRGTQKIYGAREDLACEYAKLNGERDDIVISIKESTKKLKAVLANFGSTGPLVEMWPEIGPFLKPYAKEPPISLPAIPVNLLNDTFKLPVEEKMQLQENI